PGPGGWPTPAAGGWPTPGPGGPGAPAGPPPASGGGPPVPVWTGGAPGSGWPPAGYPPPYAPPTPAPGRSAGGWVVAVVVTVVVAVVLAFCGCIGLGVLGSVLDDPGASGEPYHPQFDEPDAVPTDDPAEEAGPAPATTPSGGPGRFTVRYEVTGTGPANVQFYDADGVFRTANRVAPPWRLAFTANDRKQVQIVALAADQRNDGVTCRITINGTVVSRDSSATGGMASCFGS
ncbi:MmpS family transport accessory protein, partial [Micromonospora sp. HK10]|uniref:MmpS family transport accessory protein n=1 Tax=Micromonospora sp. HK10 TaxID=1538294 RepID=UPI001E46F0EE